MPEWWHHFKWMNLSPFFSYFKVAPLQDLEVRLEKEEKGKRYKRFFQDAEIKCQTDESKGKRFLFRRSILSCTMDIRHNVITVWFNSEKKLFVGDSLAFYDNWFRWFFGKSLNPLTYHKLKIMLCKISYYVL